MKLVTGIVIDARDIPEELVDFCDDHEISLHYAHTLAMFHEDDDEPLGKNPLVKFVLDQGIPSEAFIHDGTAYISVIGT